MTEITETDASIEPKRLGLLAQFAGPDELIAAAAENNKLLELNANPVRLDLDDAHCASAKAAGVPIVISSDAHSVDGLGVLRYGVLQARRAGLTIDDVANTRGVEKFAQR